MPGDAFIPYAPLNRLKPVADGIAIVDGPEIRMSYLGMKLPFSTRMTIVTLPDGRLWVHSPIAPDPALLADVAALGPVAFLVAPCSLHYWWLPEWQAAFPAAEVWAIPGLARRARRPLTIDHSLDEAPPQLWRDTFGQTMVSGKLFIEADFFHRPSRTLILTDLIENFEPRRIRNPLFRWFIQLSGPADPDGKAPFDMQMSFRRNRAALRAAVEEMLAWAPERVILAHGRWYETNGTAELRHAFRWAL